MARLAGEVKCLVQCSKTGTIWKLFFNTKEVFDMAVKGKTSGS